MPDQTVSHQTNPRSSQAPRLFVLLVGVDRYDPAVPVPTLRGCAADAQALQEFLVRRLDVPPERIVLLVNEQATRAAVVAAWQQHLLAQAQAHDQILFCFSGHGSQAPALGPDEPNALDETLVVYDSRTPGGCDILDKELAYLIAAAESAGRRSPCCSTAAIPAAARGPPASRRCARLPPLLRRLPLRRSWRRLQNCWRRLSSPRTTSCSPPPHPTSWPTNISTHLRRAGTAP